MAALMLAVFMVSIGCAERFLSGMFAAAVTPVAAAAIGGFTTTDRRRARLLSFVSMAGYPLTISPEMGAIAMSGSSLLVAANALLLRRAAIQGLHR